MTDLKSYAFYLPQFHPVPDNDEWWGKGFTEWRNVAAAKSRFPGHVQPRLPADLGFYDLRVPEIRHQQAELARNSGIDGFIYYHYWFNGRRILERPFEDARADDSFDFPFALCWANEDWRRNWNGFSGEMLLEQTHTDQDDEDHIAWLIEAFKDPRYIRYEGKPLFLVYRAARIPDVEAMTRLWRDRCREAGIGEIYLCRVESDNDEFDHAPAELGFDAAVEFGTEWRHLGSGALRNTEYVHSYVNTAQRILNRPRPSYVRHPGVCTGFDNTPRRSHGGVVLEGATPALYGDWVARTVRRETTRNESNAEKMLFVNAWNEWAEGAILEPCQEWGSAFLQAHADGIRRGLSDEQLTDSPVDPVHMPDLSICVVSEGDPEATMACLGAALEATKGKHTVEFVVFDNGSTDGLSSLLSELGSAIRWIRSANRVDAGQAWGAVTTLASSENVLLLSTDVELERNPLSSEAKALRRSDSFGSYLSLKSGGSTRYSRPLNALDSVAVFTTVGHLRTTGFNPKLTVGERPVGRIRSLRAADSPV